MSFVDLNTLAMHRRHDMEARIVDFGQKCDRAVHSIKKLKSEVQGYVKQLNCEPTDLKERFLNCVRRLEEYSYLITDFTLAVEKLDTASTEYSPVHDISLTTLPPTPKNTQEREAHLIDILSEPLPSTSAACPNLYPSVKQKCKKSPTNRKSEQLLIQFSSSSCSYESIPASQKTEKEAKCDTLVKEMQAITLNEADKTLPLASEAVTSRPQLSDCSLPAQELLQIDCVYPAHIMNIDGASFWIITDNANEFIRLKDEMNDYYRKTCEKLTMEEIITLTYCVYYDEETTYFYRALKITEENNVIKLFLVDTGEVVSALPHCIHQLAPRFCTKPPFARCCHLAGIELISHQVKGGEEKLESFLQQFIGTICNVFVDDNSSDSLGVYVILLSKDTVNELLVEAGLAVFIDDPAEEAAAGVVDTSTSVQPPSHVENRELDISHGPEYEDPVEAVTGYHNRDEADICKHYKGGSKKTCFKGARCKKRHVLKHPDGWTKDRVEVDVGCRTMPLPAPGSSRIVHVTHVCHYDRLYVQLVDADHENEEVPRFGVVLPPTTLAALVRDMNSPAARVAYKPLKMAPAPGELVAALYPPDDQWYRARVLSSTRADQSVEVMYVDYGNSVWVKEDAIRALEARFRVLPAQAVLCRLAGVLSPSDSSADWAAAKLALQRLVQDRTMEAKIVACDYDEVTVELYDQNGHDVAEQLAEMNVVKLTPYAVDDGAGQSRTITVVP